jgi:hypothetical protein
MIKFFRRFGGEVSFEQKLADYGRKMPLWFQPVWQVLVDWFVRHWREAKIQAELKNVDQQAWDLDSQWSKTEDAARVAEVERAAAKVQFENPDATVSVIATAMGEGSDLAILVEHPPDGSRAQELLGGAIEIKSPWMER